MTSAVSRTSELAARLSDGFCRQMRVHEIDGGWSLSTPFLFPDGDGLPIIIENQGDVWRLTDRGATAGQLFFDDYVWSDAKKARLQRFVEHGGAELSGWVITMALTEPPTAYDVADFVVALSSVLALPAVDEDAKSEQFRTKTRDVVTGLLRPECKAVKNWWPEKDSHRAYRADLHVNPNDRSRPFAAFFVGSPSSAAGVTATLFRYRAWELPELALVMVRSSTVSSDDVLYRLEDALEGEGTLIKVGDNGNKALIEELHKAGLPLMSTG